MRKRIAVISLMTAAAVIAAPAGRAYESKTYLYGGSTAIYLKRIERTNGNISVACPDYFEVDRNGEVKYSKEADPLLVSSLRDQHIVVTPFLSNHWSRDHARKMLADRADAAQRLAEAVHLHDFDGIDIDIQNITEADREAFTDFIRLLRAELPEDRRLTVCVPANPYYTDVGWQGGYDYTALAGYCDHIFIMTYDESYPGGEPGPVASFRFVEKSIQYGIDRGVPKEKLLIGIPFYGRYWKDAIKGDAFTIADIEHLVRTQQAEVWYDRERECARATVTIPAGEKVTTWGGRVISGGVYDIWYENDRSFERKLSLVRQYGIGGAGSWALGQEPEAVWAKYAGWLEGHVFYDVASHWAQPYIIELNERGIIAGRTQRLFEPEGGLTRAEAAVLLARLAGAAPLSGERPFADTAGHWGEGSIAAAKRAGLVSGVSDTRFEPDRVISREELAVMAERYTRLEDTFDVTESVYADVSAQRNPWSHAAIVKLSINNVISGYPDGKFLPGNSVTRAEAAKIISLVSRLPSRFPAGDALPEGGAHMGPR